MIDFHMQHNTSVMVYGQYRVYNPVILVTISSSKISLFKQKLRISSCIPILCVWQCTLLQQMITCHPCQHVQSLRSTPSLYKGVQREQHGGCLVFQPPPQLLLFQRPHKLYFFRNRAASGFWGMELCKQPIKNMLKQLICKTTQTQ